MSEIQVVVEPVTVVDIDVVVEPVQVTDIEVTVEPFPAGPRGPAGVVLLEANALIPDPATPAGIVVYRKFP